MGDYPHLSLHARATGSLVLKGSSGGRARLVDTGPRLDLCTRQRAHWDPEARSPLSLPVSMYALPLSQDSGHLEDPLWAHVPGFFLGATSLGSQVQSISGHRKNLTVALGAAR